MKKHKLQHCKEVFDNKHFETKSYGKKVGKKGKYNYINSFKTIICIF